jgi:hypothetical protein
VTISAIVAVIDLTSSNHDTHNISKTCCNPVKEGAMSKSKKVIYVTPTTHKMIARFAKAKGMDLGSAVERMATVAVGRLGALETYAQKMRTASRKAA